jgi:BirA family biotin operon repressor/biotin-[acetyl-CoA-carboxylase] ligase
VACETQIPAANAWQLAAAAGLALMAACHSVLPGDSTADLGLRWPNDLVDGQGRKVAGLLVETSLQGERVSQAVIGSGINVNWRRADMPPDIAERATSLCELSGTPLDRVALLRGYLSNLDSELAAVEAGRSPIDRFRDASWLTGHDVEVVEGERLVAGTAAGIGPDGSLLVQTDSGLEPLAYGEVVRVGVIEPIGSPA